MLRNDYIRLTDDRGYPRQSAGYPRSYPQGVLHTAPGCGILSSRSSRVKLLSLFTGFEQPGGLDSIPGVNPLNARRDVLRRIEMADYGKSLPWVGLRQNPQARQPRTGCRGMSVR